MDIYLLNAAIETLEQGVKSVQSQHKRHLVLVSLLLTLYIVLVNSIEFEQVKPG